jgi:hypothetical protein
MDAAALSRCKPGPFDLLIGHCLVLEPDVRPTARDRLEAMIGRDFTRRLVCALSSR